MDLPGSSPVAFLPNPSRCGRHKKRTGEPRIWFRFIRTLFISITTVTRDDESLLRSPLSHPRYIFPSRPRSNSARIYFLPWPTQWCVGCVPQPVENITERQGYRGFCGNINDGNSRGSRNCTANRRRVAARRRSPSWFSWNWRRIRWSQSRTHVWIN